MLYFGFPAYCLLCIVLERYCTEQRALNVKTHYKNRQSSAETVWKLRTIKGRNIAPSESTICRLF